MLLPASVQVRVEGLLRHGEVPGDFVPPNEPEQGACRAMCCVLCYGLEYLLRIGPPWRAAHAAASVCH